MLVRCVVAILESFFLMSPRPPRCTLTHTLLPYTTLCRSDAIYVSTLRRTAETAAALAAALGVTPVVDPDLREVHLGEWEGGLFRQKIAEGDPIAVDRKSTRLNSSH